MDQPQNTSVDEAAVQGELSHESPLLDSATSPMVKTPIWQIFLCYLGAAYLPAVAFVFSVPEEDSKLLFLLFTPVGIGVILPFPLVSPVQGFTFLVFFIMLVWYLAVVSQKDGGISPGIWIVVFLASFFQGALLLVILHGLRAMSGISG